jgi:hypothetical protein
MPLTIEDGKGKGRLAGVNLNNQLEVFAITETELDKSVLSGDRYNVNTGYVTLNSTTESALLHIKNNEDDELVVTALIYNLGQSTGGSGSCRVSVYRNPTSGTIVSGGDVVSANANMNFGSNKTLVGDYFKGAQSLTTTGGTFAIGSLVNAGSRAVVALGAVNLPKGTSLSVTITPPAGNTSMDVNVAASAYLATSDVTGR